MIQIFSKEFKDALRSAIAQGTEVVKNVVTPQTKAKVVQMYDKTVEAATEAVEQAKEKINQVKAGRPTKEEMEARTAKKKAQRDAAKKQAQDVHEATKAAIEKFRNLPDVEEIYCQRSETKPTFHEEEILYGEDYEGPKSPIIFETAKVTVIGVVKRLTNGKFRLNISLSRRNPVDQFIKNQGFLLALQRAYDTHATFEIDGHTFETIKLGDFDSPLLKDLFLAVADELIAKYEYTQETYTKPMRKSIEKNAKEMVKFILEAGK